MMKRRRSDVLKDVKSALLKGAADIKVAELIGQLADTTIEEALPSFLEQSGKKITCRKGCSHCCRQSTIVIEEADAKVISERTGLSVTRPSSQSRDWQGVACRFLAEDGTCSIYEFRPMNCRLSLSTDAAEKCKTEEYRIMVDLNSLQEAVNVGLLETPYIELMIKYRGEITADIRDFFPPDQV